MKVCSIRRASVISYTPKKQSPRLMVGLLGPNYTLVIRMCQVAAVTFWVEINPQFVDFSLILWEK
jgi:hypothetical protein